MSAAPQLPVKRRLTAPATAFDGVCTVDIWPHPLSAEGRRRLVIPVAAGMTVDDVLDRHWASRAVPAVRLDGIRLPPEAWPHTDVPPGAIVTLRAVARGDALRIIASIALIVVSIVLPYAIPATAAALGTALGASAATAGALGAAVITSTIAIVGGLVLNALLPVRPPDLPGPVAGAQAAPLYTLTGAGNSARPNRPLRIVLGQHLVYPDIAAPAYHYPVAGPEQDLRLELLVGVGDLDIADLRIGDVRTSDLAQQIVALDIRRGSRDPAAETVVTEEGPGEIEAEWSGGLVTPDGTRRIELDFSGAVVRFGAGGARMSETREVSIRWRPVGASSWTTITRDLPDAGQAGVPAPELPVTEYSALMTGATPAGPGPVRRVTTNGRTWTRTSVGLDTYESRGSGEGQMDVRVGWQWVWRPTSAEIDYYQTLLQTHRRAIAAEIRNTVTITPGTAGRIEVEVRRAAPASTDNLVQDRISWTRSRAVLTEPAGDYSGQNRISMRVRPGQSLQGRLGRISCLASLRVAIRDSTGRVRRRAATSNPAWIFAEYATGLYADGALVAGAGMPSDRIDWPSILDWAAWCGRRGVRCDALIEDDRSHRDVLTMIARCGLAAPVFSTGKLGVVIDRQEQVSSLITPGNIVSGSMSVAWASGADPADAIDVRYVDPAQDWQIATVRVPVPGATGPAARPTSITAEGVTSRSNAEREGRRQAARQVYHRRRIRWEMAAEGLALTTGDVVRITHGLLDGGSTGRVRGGTRSQPVLGPDANPAAGDRLLLRLPDGGLHNAQVRRVVDAATGEVSIRPSVSSASWPATADAVGDVLWRLYAAGDPPAAVRITGLEPQGDGTVRVEAIDEVAAYYA